MRFCGRRTSRVHVCNHTCVLRNAIPSSTRQPFDCLLPRVCLYWQSMICALHHIDHPSDARFTTQPGVGSKPGVNNQPTTRQPLGGWSWSKYFPKIFHDNLENKCKYRVFYFFKSKCIDLRNGDWLSVNRRETLAMQESRLRWHWKNSHKHNCTYQQRWKGEVTASGCLEPRGNSVKSLVVNERVRMECLPKWVPLQEHMSHPKRIWLAGFNVTVTTAAVMRVRAVHPSPCVEGS